MYFNLISTFIHDMFSEKFGLKNVNYLDDFIAVSNDYQSQSLMINFLIFLGFHVSFAKLIQPSKCVTYLGFVIDSVGMELRLPEGKVEKLQNILDIVSAKRRISKKVVSWGGLLCHCAHVIRGGRVFCKRTFKLGIIKSKIHNYDRFSVTQCALSSSTLSVCFEHIRQHRHCGSDIL